MSGAGRDSNNPTASAAPSSDAGASVGRSFFGFASINPPCAVEIKDRESEAYALLARDMANALDRFKAALDRPLTDNEDRLLDLVPLAVRRLAHDSACVPRRRSKPALRVVHSAIV